jgi:hypothetical protein
LNTLQQNEANNEENSNNDNNDNTKMIMNDQEIFNSINNIRLPPSMALLYESYLNDFNKFYPNRKIKLLPHFGTGEVFVSFILLFIYFIVLVNLILFSITQDTDC